MDFYDVINSRRTIRDFADRPIDSNVIKRVISAGMKAPSNDHMRDWEFIVATEKTVIASIIQRIPKKMQADYVESIIQSWELLDECQRTAYRNAIPRQYEMLYTAGCLILPLFKQHGDLLRPQSLSSLNSFASIWCCIENIWLAATAEGLAVTIRIPLDDEPEHIAKILNYPKEYVMPCYLALGHPAPEATGNKQIEHKIEDKIHINGW